MLTSINNIVWSLLLSVAIITLLGSSAVQAEPTDHLYIVCNYNLDTGVISVASISDTTNENFALVSTFTSCADTVAGVVGFGTFSVKHRSARMGRNPRTGQAIHISASKSPAFKAGKALKDAVLIMCEGHEIEGMGGIVLLDKNGGDNIPDVKIGGACLDGLSTLTSEKFDEKDSYVLPSLSSDCITSEPAIDCPERYNFLAIYTRYQ